MPIILVGGGSRSGKSRFALEMARARGARRMFLATAEAFDDEMRDRIRRHQAERDSSFQTLEEPLDLAGAIGRCASTCDVLVVDCLTLWLSNLLLRDLPGIEQRGLELAEAAASAPSLCILVTNEVGCGIVPENALARRFRDAAGRLNQQIAERAAEVYWLAFGLPLRMK